jgi:hypothetical protein
MTSSTYLIRRGVLSGAAILGIGAGLDHIIAKQARLFLVAIAVLLVALTTAIVGPEHIVHIMTTVAALASVVGIGVLLRWAVLYDKAKARGNTDDFSGSAC